LEPKVDDGLLGTPYPYSGPLSAFTVFSLAGWWT